MKYLTAHKLEPFALAELCWRRWGLGLELSFGDWVPKEWSACLQVGPVLMSFGMEERARTREEGDEK